MKKFILFILLLNAISSNAQHNIIMDEIMNSLEEPVGVKYDDLILYPNKSIKENYELIKKRMSLHREKQYGTYTIWVKGHYTNKKGQSCNDGGADFIQIKGKDNERFRTIDGQIINALTNLYSRQLDEPIDIPLEEISYTGADYKMTNIPLVTFSGNISGGVYVKKNIPHHSFYSLREWSPLWIKIYKKVIEETGLVDGGSEYELNKDLYLNKKSTEKIKTILKMPEFQGGMKAQLEYLNKKVKENYPQECKNNNIQGRVVISFYVETDGTFNDIQINKSINPLLDQCAIEIIKSMPRMIPAKDENNKDIRCKYTIPISFRID